MSEKSEALRLADALDAIHGDAISFRPVAAELRRLSAVEAQRDALLAALKQCLPYASTYSKYGRAAEQARAAIAAAEGEK